MCSMARDPRRRADPDPVVAVVAAVAVGVNTGNSPNHRKWKETPTTYWTSVGDVQKTLDIKKVNHAKLQRQSAETLESKEHYEKVCMKKSTHLVDSSRQFQQF